ncbi:MAG TPA: metalloregulator ArsR/SmtB family transcription factor [Candidatus Paceibacterota bacterium]|nr:metalloregulator ArsR/SmtB family transcription factor [Candidatus Paceibacterota bacterium]
MDIFTVLAEPTRRTIVEMLAGRGAMPASEIGDEFSASPPAISQHLKVLREAKVVRVEKQGKQRIYSIDPGAMHEIEAWVKRTKRMWEGRLDRLDRVIKAEQRRKNKLNK